MTDILTGRTRVERPFPQVMRIVPARPEARIAQDPRLLDELNDAFDLAAEDATFSDPAGAERIRALNAEPPAAVQGGR